MLPIISTYTGKTVDLLNPNPDDLCIEDIAHHLSLMNRFYGSTRRPYSVAAHSIYMAQHLVVPELAWQALMHDADEAYLGDVVKPLKQALPEYIEIESNFWAVLAEKFNLPVSLDERVHAADKLACQIENYQLRRSGELQYDNDSSINGAPAVSLHGWETVRWEFLDLFSELAP